MQLVKFGPHLRSRREVRSRFSSRDKHSRGRPPCCGVLVCFSNEHTEEEKEKGWSRYWYKGVYDPKDYNRRLRSIFG